MGRRRRRVVTLFLLAGLWAWGNHEASAAGTFYSWGPLHGTGWHDNYPWNNDYQTFATGDGWLGIYWDPSGMFPDSYVTASSGDSGYEVTAYNVSWTGNTLTGVGPYGASIFVSFSGGGVSVSAQGGYHQEFGFQLQSVPEPSSLLTLALGVAGLSLGAVSRRTKKRPGPRGLTGR